MNPDPFIKYPKTSLFCLGCLSALATAPVYWWFMIAIGYAALTAHLLQQTRLRTVFFQTWIFFLAYFMASLYWISHALTIDIHLWWWALPLSFTGLPALLAIFPALFAGMVLIIRRLINPPTLIAGILLIFALFAADYARSVILTGFPWNLPVHIWARTPMMMDFLPIFSLWGLNFITIMLFGMMGVFLSALVRKHYQSASFLLFIGLSMIAVMAFFPQPSSPSNTLDSLAKNYQIHMIQANISQDTKWDPRYIWQNFETYLAMSSDAVENDGKPAIIIWPETATSSSLLSYPQVNEKLKKFLTSLPLGSLLITGFLNSNYGQTPPLHYNSMVIFNTEGDILAKYDKHHLVPFGEFIPFQSFIPIGSVTGFEGFQAGSPPQYIDLVQSYGMNVLPLICYEIIFPRFLQENKTIPTNAIIINATNDAWFGKTAGAYQHFDHALFRARENNIPVLRLSGNGISAIIDSDGRIKRATYLNHSEKISLAIP